jgi:hypothetical protein
MFPLIIAYFATAGIVLLAMLEYGKTNRVLQ